MRQLGLDPLDLSLGRPQLGAQLLDACPLWCNRCRDHPVDALGDFAAGLANLFKGIGQGRFQLRQLLLAPLERFAQHL